MTLFNTRRLIDSSYLVGGIHTVQVEPASKVVVVRDSDEGGQDVDFEPPDPTIKSTTEALFETD